MPSHIDLIIVWTTKTVWCTQKHTWNLSQRLCIVRLVSTRTMRESYHVFVTIYGIDLCTSYWFHKEHYGPLGNSLAAWILMLICRECCFYSSFWHPPYQLLQNDNIQRWKFIRQNDFFYWFQIKNYCKNFTIIHIYIYTHINIDLLTFIYVYAYTMDPPWLEIK